MTNFESNLEDHAADVTAGLFYALAGIEIQDALPPAERAVGISRQRLYKVLANMVWDWNWLSGDRVGAVKLAPLPVFKWLPNRYGGLGVVAPRDNYTLPRWVGTIDFEHLPKCGPFALWGIKYVEETDRFIFPQFVAYEDEAKANVEEVDKRYWKILGRSYSRAATEHGSKFMDGLASCKTDTAAFHSLWVQVCFWRDGVLKLGQMLRDSSALFGSPKECENLKHGLEQANRAAANFSRKSRYTRDRDGYLLKARNIFSASELRNICPVVNQAKACPFSNRLEALLSWEELIQEVDLLIRAMTRAVASPIRFGPATSDLRVDQITRAASRCKLKLSIADLPSPDVVMRLGVNDRRMTGELICYLVRSMEGNFRSEFDLPLLEHNRHCETFFAEWYPWD